MRQTKIELRKLLWFVLFLFLLPGQAEGATPTKTQGPVVGVESCR